ncbi:hypothetical protein JMJ55_22860 [Belnapia sp. T6]|uniref:Uncharacterized protein n=1 Tax=Belnapia mucosa TaxID=2804532 RepID=A0ABS1VA05_9PROT|nr:hypothetical protein [Belnapia mucosa]MBL6458182.1 hypothetical protein [Belnapia mucosa]
MTADGPALETYLSGAISAPVALMRLLLPGASAAAVLEQQTAAAACRSGAAAPGQARVARAHGAGRRGAWRRGASGHDLAGVADASYDLVLAVDVFPYLVAGGTALAAGMSRRRGGYCAAMAAW